MRPIVQLAAAAGLMISLTACNALEPYGQAYSWHPMGANASNLAIMAADPRDLAQGQGTSPADGRAAAAPIDRLRRDHVKAFPDNNSSSSDVEAGAGATANN